MSSDHAAWLPDGAACIMIGAVRLVSPLAGQDMVKVTGEGSVNGCLSESSSPPNAKRVKSLEEEYRKLFLAEIYVN